MKKKTKDELELNKLINELDTIKHDKGKIEAENHNIQHESDEIGRIFL